MDDCRLTRSPSISSFDTNHSSWSFVGEDDFDLLDQDEDHSALEDEVNEMEKEDEQVEEEEDDEENEDNTDNDDDDISVVTEEDVLNDPSALLYTDVVKVSKKLDKLSKCFDSPFTHILEDFALERNVRFMAVISAAVIAIVIFYYAFGAGKSESLFFTSTENVCFVNEDYFLGPQYRDVAPSFLLPFFEALLRPSIPAWSFLPSIIPIPHAFDPFSWIFNSQSIVASQDERRYFDTNQCERVSIEHHVSGISETVRRYLRHKKKLKKPYRYVPPILANINENRKSMEQMDLHLMINNSSENWNSWKTESSEHQESIQMETSELQKLPSFSKLMLLLIPSFSANHLLIEPKLESLTPVPSLGSPVRKELTSFSESIMDLECVEKKCFKAMPDIKIMKSLENKIAKLRYSIDLRLIFLDSKLRKLEKLWGSDSEKQLRQPKKRKSEVLMGEKRNISKDRCVLNSTCNILTGLARILAGITFFPEIVGQANAAKERCTFLPWQRHFNTKWFLASQGYKMFEAFEELGWSIPGKTRRGGHGKLKFKRDHPSRYTASEKEMLSRQNKKKSMERYFRKSGVQGQIH